jgi:L-lactate dehydrogenase (cytochrome)
MIEEWGGPFMLKGLSSPEDARMAVQAGVTGVIVSNHGGRQLDHSAAAIDLLPEVVEAADGKIEVLLDGGIRRGTDIIKALALGATACMIGRPFLFGLAAGGEAGVARTMEILRTELERSMRLLGCTDVHQLNRSYLKELD